jgi:hypothetical protein
MGATQSVDSTDQFTTSLAQLESSFKQAGNDTWDLFHDTVGIPVEQQRDASGTTPIDQPMNRVQDDVDLGVKSAKHSAAAPLIRRTSSLPAFQRTSSLDSGSAVKAGDDSFASPIVRTSSDSSLRPGISGPAFSPAFAQQRIKHHTSDFTPIDKPMTRVQDDVDPGVKPAKHAVAAPLFRRTSSLPAFQRTSSLGSGSGSAVKAGDSFAPPIVRASSDSSLRPGVDVKTAGTSLGNMPTVGDSKVPKFVRTQSLTKLSSKESSTDRRKSSYFTTAAAGEGKTENTGKSKQVNWRNWHANASKPKGHTHERVPITPGQNMAGDDWAKGQLF